MRKQRLNDTTAIALAAALLAGLLAAAPAQAQPDLQITAMSVQGTPRVGKCNTVSMTVRNAGDEFTQTASIGIFLATYSQGAPNQNRAEKNAMIGPIQPGGQTSFQIQDVEFATSGQMSVQALADSAQQVAEQNENNNTRLLNTTVSGSCVTPPPPTTSTSSACDLQAIFVAPTSSTVSGPNVDLVVRFSNKTRTACPGNKIKLMRYSSSTCSGYGVQVGGSGNFQTLNPLPSNGTQDISWTDSRVKSGKYCYKMTYSSPHNDANNSNHHPQKKLAVN